MLGAAAGDVTVSHNLYHGAGDYTEPDPSAINGAPSVQIDLNNWIFELAADSPAIDRGSDTVADRVTSDFLWVARPLGAGYDVGALEGVP